MSGTQADVTSRSQVIVFPPLIPASGFLLGVLIGWFVPLAVPAPQVARGVGGALLVLGLGGFSWMVYTMKQAKTPIANNATPTALVETGPYQFTRNPMYLFGSTAYAGLALLMIEPWSLLLLPVVMAITHYGVVLREEAFLERHFGDPYKAYQARVRRWL